MSIRLEVVSQCNCLVDFGNIHPKSLCALSTKEIESLMVDCGNRAVELGEFCAVRRNTDTIEEVQISGFTSQIIKAGYAMDGGRMIIAGDAGPLAGAEMSGGKLEVLGNAGDGLGSAINGGMIQVRGHAGDRCGASFYGQSVGMSGGVIIVDGDVGAEVGACMRRGLIVIGGNSGVYPGASMLAGTILCFGRVGSGAGLHLKRGTIVGSEFTRISPGFRLSGEADLEWLRICLHWMNRLGVVYPEKWLHKLPVFYTGDHLALGKGELLDYGLS